MTLRKELAQRHSWHALALVVVIVLQVLTSAFFLWDVVNDVRANGAIRGLEMWTEAAASVALIAGMVFLVIELRRVFSRMAQLDSSIRAAQGHMGEVIDGFFIAWRLTPSERDVAMLALKGLENDDIARLRGTAQGTVRAQCASVYAKAGVTGRAQLFSVFMEELLAGEN